MEEVEQPSCAVCACFFKEHGQHVPKLLPCSHTLCKNCLEKLTRRTGITCPECRKRHRAANGERTFPQNKYVLDLIKILKQRSVNENPGQATGSPGLCPDHDRELSLRCDSDKCRKIICQVCLLEERSNHTDIVVDVLLETKATSNFRWRYHTSKAQFILVKGEPVSVGVSLFSRISLESVQNH